MLAFEKGASLLRAVHPVAGIAETGTNIGVLVEFSIDRGCHDWHIRMGLSKNFQTFRCCNDADELNMFCARLLQSLDRRCCGAAGCQHGVNHDAQSLFKSIGQLDVVFHRYMSIRFPVKANMSDAGGGHQVEHAVEQAVSGAQDGNQA